MENKRCWTFSSVFYSTKDSILFSFFFFTFSHNRLGMQDVYHFNTCWTSKQKSSFILIFVIWLKWIYFSTKLASLHSIAHSTFKIWMCQKKWVPNESINLWNMQHCLLCVCVCVSKSHCGIKNPLIISNCYYFTRCKCTQNAIVFFSSLLLIRRALDNCRLISSCNVDKHK